MSIISNIHKSFSFTILVIIATLTGIIVSLHYSNSKNNYFTTMHLNISSGNPSKIYSNYGHEYGRIELDFNSLESSKYPLDSVPVKVVLGKIKKIENPYLPRLHLALLEADKKYFNKQYSIFNRPNLMNKIITQDKINSSNTK